MRYNNVDIIFIEYLVIAELADQDNFHGTCFIFRFVDLISDIV